MLRPEGQLGLVRYSHNAGVIVTGMTRYAGNAGVIVTVPVTMTPALPAYLDKVCS